MNVKKTFQQAAGVPKKVAQTALTAGVHGISSFPEGDEYLKKAAGMLQCPTVSSAEKLVMGGGRRRRSVSDSLVGAILEHDPQVTESLTAQGVAGRISDPYLLERLAARAEKREDLDAAVALRQKALVADPKTSHRYVALGLTLKKSMRPGILRDTTLGLTDGEVPRTDEALASFEKALEFAPGNAFILHELGQLYLNVGEQEKGLDYLEMAVLKKGRTDWLLELAAQYRKPQVAQFDKSLVTYERAFVKNPKDTKALAGVINMGIRGSLDWARVWRSARQLEIGGKKKLPEALKELLEALGELFSPRARLEDVEAALLALESSRAQGKRLHPTNTGLVAARLQSLGYMAKGFDMRADLARQTIARISASASEDSERLRRLVAALIYVNDLRVASQVLTPSFGSKASTPKDELRREKLKADVALMKGEKSAYLSYALKRQEEQPLHADDRMRKLVEGKRVAIVGPADTGDELGEEIDKFDVIARTRFQKDFIQENSHRQGSRTDIAYYNGRDVAEMYDQIQRYVDDGDLKLVVSRPLSYESLRHIDADWLRFYRHDFSLYHYGMALALPRITYDLLQYDPAEICLFNTDMYTGDNAFAAGYRNEQKGLAPGSVLNDLIISHDLKTDFKLFKAMQASGVLTARGVTKEVLDLTPDEYVAKLEQGGALY